LIKALTQDEYPQSAETLLPLVYQELRRLASAKLAREKAGHTLQPTALVHEAWLRIAGENKPDWKGKAQFFSAAAEAMRRLLIESARAKRSAKRGNDPAQELLRESQIEVRATDDELLAVHDALEALALEDPEAAELVKLRYFVGCTIPEIAEILSISPRSADRQWAFARAWLKREIRRS
jgi:RNA polymerase sigma factor (TIGR02999 family)